MMSAESRRDQSRRTWWLATYTVAVACSTDVGGNDASVVADVVTDADLPSQRDATVDANVDAGDAPVGCIRLAECTSNVSGRWRPVDMCHSFELGVCSTPEIRSIRTRSFVGELAIDGMRFASRYEASLEHAANIPPRCGATAVCTEAQNQQPELGCAVDAGFCNCAWTTTISATQAGLVTITGTIATLTSSVGNTVYRACRAGRYLFVESEPASYRTTMVFEALE